MERRKLLHPSSIFAPYVFILVLLTISSPSSAFSSVGLRPSPVVEARGGGAGRGIIIGTHDAPRARTTMTAIIADADDESTEGEVSSSSGYVVADRGGGETTTTTPVGGPTVNCPNCDLCDGSGRILGGIGMVLEWWPIKAYRPCPNFVDRGGRYVRAGQGLDEIAFGRDSTFRSDD
ncbi:hypothetical protein ACHAXA_004383 [Cyclostephanos tholiformis]|uniref:Uncharacterized protein n=1 Tax=Cyclostephanos tholiformis TaxID=382380 RepID=A0ABD3RIP4_9STRA